MHCFYISDLNVSYTAETKNLTSWWVDHRPHIVQLLYLTNVQNAQGHLVPRGATPRAAIFGDSRRGRARSPIR